MKKSRLPILALIGLMGIVACQATISSSTSNINESSYDPNSTINSIINSDNDDTSRNSFGGNKKSSFGTPNGSSSSSKTSTTSTTSITSTTTSKYSTSGFTGGNVTPDAKWNINLSLRGNSFRLELETLIKEKQTSTCSYDANSSIGPQAAAYKDTGKFVPFYHTTDTLVTYSSCNKEHTWPNSRGAGKSGPGADPFIIRPTLTSENSSRGNNFYGLGDREWDPASCGFEGSRGESARVILYAATRYYSSHGFELSNNPYDSTSMKTMGTLKYLIQWNLTYPVTDMEKQINDYLDGRGFGRNPFVDHPEYANYIWNENGLLDSVGGLDPVDGETYDLHSNLDTIDNGEFILASSPDSQGSSFYYLTSDVQSESTPWYVKGVNCLISSDKQTLTRVNKGAEMSYYKLSKNASGSYTVRHKDSGKYLVSYVNDTHYNIGLETSSNTAGKDYNWNLVPSNNGFYFIGATSGIYLEYYKGSFTGFNKQPNSPIYLYA